MKRTIALLALAFVLTATTVMAEESTPIPERPTFAPDWGDSWEYHSALMARYWVKGGKVFLHEEMEKVGKTLLQISWDPTERAVGWAMLVEYYDPHGFGITGEVARYGLFVALCSPWTQIHPKAEEAIKVRLVDHGGWMPHLVREDE